MTDTYSPRTLGEYLAAERERERLETETAREERLRHVRLDCEWLAADALPHISLGDQQDIVDEIVCEIKARLLGIAQPASNVQEDHAKEGTQDGNADTR